MKANAPEKIYAYISDDDIVGTASLQKGVPHQFVTEKYTRTDAFIEKACDWLEDNIDRYLYNTGGYGEYIPKCGGKMYEDFKKAMEE